MYRQFPMMSRLLAACLALALSSAQATETHVPKDKTGSAPAAGAHDDHAAAHGSELAQVKGAIDAIVGANQRYAKTHPPGYFNRFADQQTPRATVITCSDSRVQTAGFSADAMNDLFMVRNIGNQLATAEGSVEYGVRHLHTPLLLIVGHAVCGAVKAASGDYSGIEKPIEKELATITIPKGIDVTDGVLLNVNNQVDASLLKFAGEVESGKLAVIGAFYDFRNDLRQGYGKLVITNINGEAEPARIRDIVKNGRFFKYGVAQQ